MGYKNKQQADITCTSNEQENNDSAPIGMPPNILMKVSWAKQLRFLTVEDKAAVLTNIFNYYTGDDLVEMNPVGEMFFATATEVFDYNISKYEDTVKLNRIKGKKGGRPTKETQDNPTGLLENPNNLKEKDKVKEKDKAIDKANEKEIDKPDIRIEKEKFRKIEEIDFRTIPDMESKYFCYDVLELVEKLGWARFDLLMFGTGAKEVPEVLNDFNLIELEPIITKTKRSYNFYFNKLLK
ncbi:MAG: hypothetical protein RL372_749 [Bacteroidota bacterium]|jgi:hypothetical protein